MKKILFAAAALSAGFTIAALAANTEGPDPHVDVNLLEEGSVTTAEGLAAWGRIYEVVSHPRCANCHVGDDNIPMWSGPTYGTARPHGMNINAGESRIGAETLMCSTCHITSSDFDTAPNAAPRYGIDWSLAPVEFLWYGQSSVQICAQMKNPDTNGDRDWQGLVDHLVHDAEAFGPVLWGFNPSGGREPAPYGLQAHVNDMIAWGAAGQPCPTE